MGVCVFQDINGGKCNISFVVNEGVTIKSCFYSISFDNNLCLSKSISFNVRQTAPCTHTHTRIAREKHFAWEKTENEMKCKDKNEINIKKNE